MSERRGDEDAVDYGMRTGRLHPNEAGILRDMIGRERSRVYASGGMADATTDTEAYIEGLPTDRLAQLVRAAAGLPGAYSPAAGLPGTGDTPLLDAEDRALAYPGSPGWHRFRKERERAEDLAAEASYRDQLEAEEKARYANHLTDAEYDSLFRRDG